ncbi:MAG: 6,7-dimethyl-8-ribityllumazine synthase [Candidatus Saccharimonadales bacterium]
MNKIKIAIVSSSFRQEVANNLEKNALETFEKNRVSKDQIKIVRVPGSLEIPLAVKKLAKSGEYQAIITFGAIVKGETYHFEQISNEVARACMDISLEYEIPVIFEVWSVYKLEHAIERATRKEENKGIEAAETALEIIKVMEKI